MLAEQVVLARVLHWQPDTMAAMSARQVRAWAGIVLRSQGGSGDGGGSRVACTGGPSMTTDKGVSVGLDGMADDDVLAQLEAMGIMRG